MRITDDFAKCNTNILDNVTLANVALSDASFVGVEVKTSPNQIKSRAEPELLIYTMIYRTLPFWQPED